MSNVLAAETPVRLHNGDVVIVAPFTNREMLTIFNLIRRKRQSALVESIPKDLPPELYKAAYTEAVKMSQDFAIDNIGDVISELADIDIIATIVRLAIHKRFKGDIEKKVDEILDNQEDFNAVLAATNSSDDTEDEEDSGNELPPATVQP